MPTGSTLAAIRHLDGGRGVEALVSSDDGLIKGELSKLSESWRPFSDRETEDVARGRHGWMEVGQGGEVTNFPSVPREALEGHIYAIDAADLKGPGSSPDQLTVLAAEHLEKHYIRFIIQRCASDVEVYSIPLAARPDSVHASRVFDRSVTPSGGAVIGERLEIWDCGTLAAADST